MGGLKKKGNVVLEEKPKPKQLSMIEQIALKRNMLKKVEAAPKPPPEKKVNPRDLLSQQIKLRFQNLKMHEKEEEDNDSDSDEDSS